MKVTLLAVFGHYDSRGGTTAIPLESRTEAAVEAAITEYNELFDWNGTLDSYAKDSSQWAWDPTAPNSSPGHTDFLFVAELHYPDDATLDGDLEEAGAVIIDEDSEGVVEAVDPPAMWKAGVTLIDPVQLEFIPLEGGKYGDWMRWSQLPENLNLAGEANNDSGAHEESILDNAQVLRGNNVKVRDWNDDAFGFMIGTGL